MVQWITVDSTKRLMNRTWTPKAEVVEGLIWEGDKVVLAGPYAIGKSPLLQDLSCHLIYGKRWCGRKTMQKPIVYIDYENTPVSIVRNFRASCARIGVPPPESEDQIRFYLGNDEPSEPNTMELLKLATGGSDPKWNRRWNFLKRQLDRQPESVVLIDPIPLFLPAKWNEPHQVEEIAIQLTVLMGNYPKACFLGTHNLRKWDASSGPRSDLALEPREWLQEVSGSGAILYRADVRLGMDATKDGEQIIAGIRRSIGPIPPLLITEAYDENGEPAGFTNQDVEEKEWAQFFASKGRTREWWEALPQTFHFREAARLGKLYDIRSPKTISDRLKWLRLHNALETDADGVYHRTQTGEVGKVTP